MIRMPCQSQKPTMPHLLDHAQGVLTHLVENFANQLNIDRASAPRQQDHIHEAFHKLACGLS